MPPSVSFQYSECMIVQSGFVIEWLWIAIFLFYGKISPAHRSEYHFLCPNCDYKAPNEPSYIEHPVSQNVRQYFNKEWLYKSRLKKRQINTETSTATIIIQMNILQWQKISKCSPVLNLWYGWPLSHKCLWSWKE